MKPGWSPGVVLVTKYTFAGPIAVPIATNH